MTLALHQLRQTLPAPHLHPNQDLQKTFLISFKFTAKNGNQSQDIQGEQDLKIHHICNNDLIISNNMNSYSILSQIDLSHHPLGRIINKTRTKNPNGRKTPIKLKVPLLLVSPTLDAQERSPAASSQPLPTLMLNYALKTCPKKINWMLHTGVYFLLPVFQISRYLILIFQPLCIECVGW